MILMKGMIGMETTIKKNQTAKVGEKYSYKYVDIAQIHDYLESINSRYIQKIQRIDTDDYIMTKRYINGKWEEEWLQGARVVDATLVGNNNPAQQQGSALTYARRYSLLMAYGLATEDDDAQSLSTPKEITMEYAQNYIFNFGKHNGEKLIDVIEEDDSYIDWLLKQEKTSQDLIKSIELLSGLVPPQTTDEDIYLTIKFNDTLNETGQDLNQILKHYEVKEYDELTKEQKEEAIKIMLKKQKQQATLEVPFDIGD